MIQSDAMVCAGEHRELHVSEYSTIVVSIKKNLRCILQNKLIIPQVKVYCWMSVWCAPIHSVVCRYLDLCKIHNYQIFFFSKKGCGDEVPTILEMKAPPDFSREGFGVGTNSKKWQFCKGLILDKSTKKKVKNVKIARNFGNNHTSHRLFFKVCKCDNIIIEVGAVCRIVTPIT